MCLKTALRWIRADKDTKHLIVGHSSNPRTQRTLDHRSLHISLKTMIKKDLDNGLTISTYLTVNDTLLYLVLSSGGTRSIRYVSYNTRDRSKEVSKRKGAVITRSRAENMVDSHDDRMGTVSDSA